MTTAMRRALLELTLLPISMVSPFTRMVEPSRSVGTRPYRQRGGDEADCGDEHRVRQPEADPGAQLRPNHALEAELAVPHDIGDELREREEQSDDDGERQHHADEDLAAVRRFARTVRLAGDAGARRSFRGNVRRWLRTVPSVGFDVEDDRIVVAGFARILPAGTVRAAFGIEPWDQTYQRKTC